MREENMTTQVEIYTWSHCPYCRRAKKLLNNKSIEFTEHCVDNNDKAREEMAKRANGRRSMPQIFINNQHIGGCDDLHELEYGGNLDSLLNITPTSANQLNN